MQSEGVCSEKYLQVLDSNGDLEEIIRTRESNRTAVNSNAEAVARALRREFQT